jgi:hypothetical protein
MLLKQISVKYKLERKKYMSLWRCESELMTMMMSRFPKTTILGTWYMDRKRLKMRGCRYGSSLTPRRRKFETAVWFLTSVLVKDLMENSGKRKQNVSASHQYPGIYYKNST